ncbi:acyltransferase [Gordonia iterans]|uniref:Acyltransferase n=1 Tax=Gordonia iterans TaxID=1004901 RepID=A0A2S0KCP6_9ACTN|nr:acyltransferase family protein [Gordonia iterans]AVL99433.1 acyltransferase [Gordonia iterans]
MTGVTRVSGSANPPTPNEDAAAGYNSGYRLDLDGLRGIAIFLVAVFHVWFGRVSGGVDVFLTLSGYFFIASLLKHVTNSVPTDVPWKRAVNPWPRFKRLLRRLIPALFLLLAFVAAMIWWIMPTTRWGPLGEEIVASALYFQNYHLAFAAQDYGAADSAVSPLQHLWSMSMQGQFFLVTLLVALLLGGLLKAGARRWPVLGRRNTVAWIVALSILAVVVVSFAWANWRHDINQPFNYYDTVARLWEPLVGGLLAIWMPRLALAQWLRTALTFVGVALIATSGIWIAGVQEYPAAMALVPVGATLLIIWAGSSATAPRPVPGADLSLGGRVLSHPAIVWLGSIAYALYLWHWPLLIFYLSWRMKNEVNFLEGAAILIVSVLIAWATTKFVETPLRGGRGDGFSRRYRRFLAAALVVLSVFAGSSAVYWQARAASLQVDTTNLDPHLYPGARAFLDSVPAPAIPPVPSPEAAAEDWPLNHLDHFSNFGDPAIKVGVYGDPNAERTIAVAGGSHSEHWMTALDALGKKRGFRVTTYMKAGCALSTEAYVEFQGEVLTECKDWVRAVMNRLAEDKPDIVFTTSTRPIEGPTKGDYVPEGYLDIFTEFRERGQKVIAVRDTPWAMSGPMSPPECIAAGRKPSVCGTPREASLSAVNPTDALVDEFPNITFIEYSNAMCDDEYCPAVVGNILVWHDRHHLTTAFVRSLIPYLEKDIQRATGWW